jgi:hypothetical protein
VTRVLIVQKPGGVPTGPADGTSVFDDTGASGGVTITHLTPGQTYGYAAWTYDADGVAASPVSAQAVPTAGASEPVTTLHTSVAESQSGWLGGP